MNIDILSCKSYCIVTQIYDQAKKKKKNKNCEVWSKGIWSLLIFPNWNK